VPRIPGLGWYTLAGAIFVGGFAFAGMLTRGFIAGFEPAVRFLAPGEVQVPIAAPGDQVLWHEHRTLYQGRAFNVAPAMPDGTRYRVQAPDGSPIAIEPHSGTSSEGSEGSSVSVGHFAASSAGVYRVVVEGLTEPRIMAVGPNRAWPIMRLVAEASLIVLLALGGRLPLASMGSSAPWKRQAPPVRARTRKLPCASSRVSYMACRRAQASGTWLDSHFTWQIRTFWWSVVWCVLGIATAIVLVGVFILIGSGVWFVYRIVRGWIELNEGRPMYAAK